MVGVLVWSNDRGQLTVEAEEVTPLGEGAVAAMIAEVRARLAADGILARPRRALPRLPAVIGVLCGADAAVRKDIESVVAVRFPGYPLAVEETTVSGPGAALAITTALAQLSRTPGVEVIVLARGGGDATQLLPWSDEELCRAVAACPVPVVSAIGHEADRPLCDEVADVRCGTPSIAAHVVVPDREEIEAQLSALITGADAALGRSWRGSSERLARVATGTALGTAVDRARARARHAGERLSWAHPGRGVADCRARLERCDWRGPARSLLSSRSERLEGVHRQARALSPQHVIERGFAVVRRSDGLVVRSPSEVSAGELLELTIARGRIRRAG